MQPPIFALIWLTVSNMRLTLVSARSQVILEHRKHDIGLRHAVLIGASVALTELYVVLLHEVIDAGGKKNDQQHPSPGVPTVALA